MIFYLIIIDYSFFSPIKLIASMRFMLDSMQISIGQ